MKYLTPVDALIDAVDAAGGKTALASKLNASNKAQTISGPSVWNWIKRGVGAPAGVCPDIEAVTGVKCEALRPEVNWSVLRGKPARRSTAKAAA